MHSRTSRRILEAIRKESLRTVARKSLDVALVSLANWLLRRTSEGYQRELQQIINDGMEANANKSRPSIADAPDASEIADRVMRELYDEAFSIYERDGQTAVERWAELPRVRPFINYRKCEPCEWDTPHLASDCAVCGTRNEEP